MRSRRSHDPPAEIAAGFGSVVALALLPLVLWHDALGEILTSFRWSWRYFLADLCPWLLIVSGLLFLIPVASSAGRDPESRLYPRARGAYLGWGVVLYVLGIGLATQVVEVWSSS